MALQPLHGCLHLLRECGGVVLDPLENVSKRMRAMTRIAVQAGVDALQWQVNRSADAGLVVRTRS